MGSGFKFENLISSIKSDPVIPYNLPICDEKIHLSVRERRLSEGAVKPLMMD
jgi:hypothetical protein